MRLHLYLLCYLIGFAHSKSRGDKLSPVKDKRDLFIGTHINPCTGSFSNDVYDPNMKCPTKTPTASPSKLPDTSPSSNIDTTPSDNTNTSPSMNPTRSSVPFPTNDQIVGDPTSQSSSSPSLSPINQSITYECPGNVCNFESEENVLIVSYLYTIEASQTDMIPNELSNLVEAGLVEVVAESLLGHCLTFQDSVRALLQTPEHSKNAYKRRVLAYKRRLDPTGVCNLPKDEYVPSKECLAVQDEENLCYVFQGHVSIFVEADDNIEAISTQVYSVVKTAMDQDALVAEDTGIRKVTFIGEEADTNDVGGIGGEVGAVIDSNADKKKNSLHAGIIVGSCIAGLILLFGLILIRRKTETEEYAEVDEGPFGLVVFPGLFEGPDENNLAKRCTCQDVKICTSQTCRCFEERSDPVCFVNASKGANAMKKATKGLSPFSTFENPLRFLFGSKSEDSSIQPSKSDITDEFY